jgi:hypothetical protein
MTRLLFAGIGLMVMIGFVSAQDKNGYDRVRVEVGLATEHVPKGLTAYTTTLVAADGTVERKMKQVTLRLEPKQADKE